MFSTSNIETELQKSWMTGEISQPALINPVTAARSVLHKLPEDFIRKLWVHLLEGFNLWKAECGVKPSIGAGLLDIDPTPFDSAQAYECTPHGPGIRGWGQFFLFLDSAQYQPIAHVIDQLSLNTILATLILKEAEDGHVEQVRMLYERLVQDQLLVAQGQAIENLSKVLEMMPTVIKAKRTNKLNRLSASKPRVRDPFTLLLRRTIDALKVSNSELTPKNIAVELGVHDQERILGYVDDAGQFHPSTDSGGKNAYYSKGKGVVTCYWNGQSHKFDHKNICDRRDNYLNPRKTNNLPSSG